MATKGAITAGTEKGDYCARQVLYLGEIYDSQRAAWSRAIEVFDEGGQ